MSKIAPTIVVATLTALRAFCFHASAQENESGAASIASVDVAVEKHGGPLLVEAAVHGSQLDLTTPERPNRCTLLVDTGATHSCFDVSLREILGAPIGTFDLTTAPGNIDLEAFQAPTISIGDFRLQSTTGVVARLDLASFSRFLGVKVDGLLGMDVLRSVVLVIDFDGGKLRIQTGEAPPAGERVPLVWKGEEGAERPYVRTKFADGMELDFLLDTAGMSIQAGALQGEIFDRFMSRGILTTCEPSDPRRRFAFGTIDAVIKSDVARAASLAVGPYTHRDLALGRHPRTNLLGLGYLSRYRVVFDFPHSAMYLRRGRDFSRADRAYGLYTIDVSRGDTGVGVDAFSAQTATGAAERARSAADVRRGDLLVALNGESTERMTLFSIRRFLAVEEYQVLDFLRNGCARRAVLDLRDGPEEAAERASGESGKAD
jgi:hypothetical protein